MHIFISGASGWIGSAAVEEFLNAFGHFGWVGRFFAMDVPADSAITQHLLAWSPTGPTLIQDLDGGFYFQS